MLIKGGANIINLKIKVESVSENDVDVTLDVPKNLSKATDHEKIVVDKIKKSFSEWLKDKLEKEI